MRGFRGSRSVQNAISSRFGRDHSEQVHDKDKHEQSSTEHQHARPTLPDWLKTPETKAREEYEAQHPQDHDREPAVVLPIRRPVAAKVVTPQVKPEPVRAAVAKVTAPEGRKKVAPARAGRKPVAAAKAKPAARKTVAKAATAKRTVTVKRKRA